MAEAESHPVFVVFISFPEVKDQSLSQPPLPLFLYFNLAQATIFLLSVFAKTDRMGLFPPKGECDIDQFSPSHATSFPSSNSGARRIVSPFLQIFHGFRCPPLEPVPPPLVNYKSFFLFSLF